jgi:transcriptional regulator with XRE-family HTH domain
MSAKSRNSVDIEFRRNLDAIMKERSLSLQEIATMAGVSKSVAHSWTTGAVPQNLPAVARLADELGVSFKVLLLGEQDNHMQGFSPGHVFDMQDVFDGLCVLSIKKVIPKGKK